MLWPTVFENSEVTQATLPVANSVVTVASLFGIPEAFKDMRAFQAEDTEMSTLIKARVKPPNYSVEQWVLLHKLPNQTKPRVVLPNRLFNMVFKCYHESQSAAQMVIKKALARISPFSGPKACERPLPI